MRLLIAIPDGIGYYRARNRFGGMHTYERELLLETTVHKIIGPLRQVNGLAHSVGVHAFIPQIYRDQMDDRDLRWVTPEIFCARAYRHHNPKSLAAFLASGDKELIIQEAL